MSGRTDTERLEWLANRSCSFENYGPGDNDPRCLMDACGNRVGRRGTDIRKMIDAAMDAEERG